MIHQHIYQLHDITQIFDPFKIIDYFDIRLKYVPFLNNPQGQYLKLLEQPYILLSEALKHSPKRYFVLAHELFHAVEHGDLMGYYMLNEHSNNKLEHEANKFAILLCMHLYKETHDYSFVTTEHIQQRYNIPQELTYMIETNQNYIDF